MRFIVILCACCFSLVAMAQQAGSAIEPPTHIKVNVGQSPCEAVRVNYFHPLAVRYVQPDYPTVALFVSATKEANKKLFRREDQWCERKWNEEDFERYEGRINMPPLNETRILLGMAAQENEKLAAQAESSRQAAVRLQEQVARLEEEAAAEDHRETRVVVVHRPRRVVQPDFQRVALE